MRLTSDSDFMSRTVKRVIVPRRSVFFALPFIALILIFAAEWGNIDPLSIHTSGACLSAVHCNEAAQTVHVPDSTEQREFSSSLSYDSELAMYTGKAIMKQSTAVIIGLVRNAGDAQKNGNMTQRVEALGEMFKDYRVLVVENDSKDNTPDMLKKWRESNPRVSLILSEFKFNENFGKSTNHVRFKRMSLIRNLYMLELAVNPAYAAMQYVMIIDMDNKLGWDYDGVARSFALPKFHLPAGQGARDWGYPMEWDMVCANGNLMSLGGLHYQHKPMGMKSVSELSSSKRSYADMLHSTEHSRLPPHRFRELIGLTPDGSFNFAENAYKLVLMTQHMTYTGPIIKNENDPHYDGYLEEDLGELSGKGNAGLMEFINTQFAKEDSNKLQAVLLSYIEDLKKQRGQSMDANSNVTSNRGISNETTYSREDNSNMTTSALSLASISAQSTIKSEQASQHDAEAVFDRNGEFDIAATMAKKIVKHISLPQWTSSNTTRLNYRKGAFEAAIANVYREGLRAQITAVTKLETNYHVVRGRFYDSLAFRDATFRKDNFRTHQYITHLETDWPYYVDHCFGGLAIYRHDAIRGCQYDTQTMECEHFSLHQCMKGNGYGKILFNPAMTVHYGTR
eukprot:CFRG1805T1